MKIGPYKLTNNLILAPMAGITDKPFRQICRNMGASLAVSEMLSSNPKVWGTEKSKTRMNHQNENGIKSVQIAGSDAVLMAEAAQFNVENGAQIIDINMGCPAKKVNKKLAGSALLKEPKLVASILSKVVQSVRVPVTLKIRTGWDKQHKNAVEIAKIAENAGIAALTIHGRTKACLFKGEAEYTTIRQVKHAINIPVIANGDVDSIYKAKQVLTETQADALMIGRAALGNPWIFRQINAYLKYGSHEALITPSEQKQVMLEHLQGIYALYGEYSGVRIARKHIGWYLQNRLQGNQYRKQFNSMESTTSQIALIHDYFNNLHAATYSSVA